jgi:hypothetical protein
MAGVSHSLAFGTLTYLTKNYLQPVEEHVQARLDEGRYVPLATEASSVYKIAYGFFFISIGSFSWISTTLSSRTITNRFGIFFPPELMIRGGIGIVKEGVFDMALSPSLVLLQYLLS